MFTGIIITTGRIAGKSATKLVIAPGKKLEGIGAGSSISVNGVCLTVVDYKSGKIYFELSSETLKKTNLGNRSTRRVNLELPLQLEGSLGGHIVYGHVDTLGKINRIRRRGKTRLFSFQVPGKFNPYLTEKGAIAIDGISLTPFNTQKGKFEISVLPFTYQSTNLKYKSTGDKVNVEFDILAKYIVKREGDIDDF